MSFLQGALRLLNQPFCNSFITNLTTTANKENYISILNRNKRKSINSHSKSHPTPRPSTFITVSLYLQSTNCDAIVYADINLLLKSLDCDIQWFLSARTNIQTQTLLREGDQSTIGQRIRFNLSPTDRTPFCMFSRVFLGRFSVLGNVFFTYKFLHSKCQQNIYMGNTYLFLKMDMLMQSSVKMTLSR